MTRWDMAFIEPMHRNKPNITYLLVHMTCGLFDANPSLIGLAKLQFHLNQMQKYSYHKIIEMT